MATKKDASSGPQTKGRKGPNTYVILFVVICAIAILTWFVPGGAYDLDEAGHAIAGTYHPIESNPQGIWDIIMAPILGMVGSSTTSAAISICLGIMFFGSFLSMVDTTDAVNLAIRRITARQSKSSHALIITLISIMAFFGTVEGCYEEGIVYFLMFVPVLLAIGLDTVVAVMIVIVGSQIGCLASTVNPFSVGIASGIAGVSTGDGMVLRLVLLVVLVALASIVICRYADMVQAYPEGSIQFFRREQDLEEFSGSSDDTSELTRTQKVTLVIFIAVFVIMAFGFIPWTSLNSNWTFFYDFIDLVNASPILSMALGRTITPFGDWYFNELSLLLLVATILIGLVNKYDINKTIDITLKGASDLIPTALVVPMARGIQVVMDAGGITPTVLNMGEQTLSSLPPVAFVIVSLVFYFLLSIFIPSSTGMAAATMGIMASLAQFANVPVSLMVTIMCMALGMAKMVTPASVVVMTVTSAAHIAYTDWVRKILPVIGLIFVICVVALIVSVTVI